jgi:hypothetical protein
MADGWTGEPAQPFARKQVLKKGLPSWKAGRSYNKSKSFDLRSGGIIGRAAM